VLPAVERSFARAARSRAFLRADHASLHASLRCWRGDCENHRHFIALSANPAVVPTPALAPIMSEFKRSLRIASSAFPPRATGHHRTRCADSPFFLASIPRGPDVPRGFPSLFSRHQRRVGPQQQHSWLPAPPPARQKKVRPF
jgi:hypothetical protein